jgi:hypothetical protein
MLNAESKKKPGKKNFSGLKGIIEKRKAKRYQTRFVIVLLLVLESVESFDHN